MRRNSRPALVPAPSVAGVLALALGLGSAAPGATKTPAWQQAQKQKQNQKQGGGGSASFAAQRMLEKARKLLERREEERAIKLLETITEQYPKKRVRFKAYLTLGKHHLEGKQHEKAIRYLENLKNVAPEKDRSKLEGEAQSLYLQGLYYKGKAYFELGRYDSAFPVLRKITENYPNTLWANQAYYYIGMCHFASENWGSAIDALKLVGTFVDPDSPSIDYVEAGRRFYVKVQDEDLPVLQKLGKEVRVDVRAESGDRETITCIPLGGDKPVFVGSLPTELGPAKKDDGTLQVVGGDTITTAYTDANTRGGAKDVARKRKVQVVSSANLDFTLGDFKTNASAGFLGSSLFVKLSDADKDASKKRDSVTIRLVSRYKKKKKQGGDSFELSRFMAAGKRDQYKTRDGVSLSVEELGEKKPIHTGEFGGSVKLKRFDEDEPVNKTDDTLACAVGDQVVAIYTDERHIKGTTPREVTASVDVAGEVSGKPTARQYVVSDPVVRAKKRLVEARAYLELARIFKNMGLKDHAADKADEGLKRVNEIIRSQNPIPDDVTAKAFKTKWQLQLAKDQLGRAIDTCQLFNRLYPNSPLVDKALMGIAEIKMQKKDYQGAISIYRQVLNLNESQAKAKAQFQIAKAIEKRNEGKDRSAEAIRAYKRCAERYPHSEYAGQSLAKLVDYYIEKRDYARANDLLDQIFEDYPDSDFLDSMLLKWVMVAYRMGDYQKAYEKCKTLVFEYPGSQFAERAKKILPKIKAKVK